MSVNKVMLVGRLGKDPELVKTQSGTSKCRMSIATHEVYYKDKEKREITEWHNIVAWGKLADVAGEYLKKGREIYVEGKLVNRSWEDEKTKETRYATEVKAQNIVFLGNGGASYSEDPDKADFAD